MRASADPAKCKHRMLTAPKNEKSPMAVRPPGESCNFGEYATRYAAP